MAKSTLSSLCMQTAVKNWLRYRNEHVEIVPPPLIKEIRDYLSPWQLYRTQHLFEHVQVDTTEAFALIFERFYFGLNALLKSRDVSRHSIACHLLTQSLTINDIMEQFVNQLWSLRSRT